MQNCLLAECLLLHQLAIHLLFLKTVQESLSHCHHQGFFEDVQPKKQNQSLKGRRALTIHFKQHIPGAIQYINAIKR